MTQYCTFSDAFSFESLYRAYRKSRKGKRRKGSVALFELNTLGNLHRLSQELLSGEYQMQPYYTFRVYEPKERIIKAAEFRDRIVQRSLCDNILIPEIYPHFIYDNCASQKKKGTHFGLKRLHRAMRGYYCQHGAEGWVLKGDISKYFYSIRHDILKQQVRKYLHDPRAVALCEHIIDSIEGEVGVATGNQSSQAFGLLYLNDLDHFVKDQCGVKYYGRYMDDFYIIMQDKASLQVLLKRIQSKVEELGLKLNPKTQIFPLKNGIDLLGFHSYLTASGRIIKKIRRSSKQNVKRRLKRNLVLVHQGKQSMKTVMQSLQCWMAHAKHGDTYWLRCKVQKLFSDWCYIILDAGGGCYHQT